jgi:hypothetical protein
MVADESRFQIVETQRVFESGDAERYSRLDFALAVLDILRPDIDVVVYPGRRRLQIERGRNWSQRPDAAWALIGIPPNASRYQVAFALAELVGKAHEPFVVDLLARTRLATPCVS